MRHNKFLLQISRGNAATYLRCCGQRYIGLVANYILFLALKKLEIGYDLTTLYSKLNLARFGTQFSEFCSYWSRFTLSVYTFVLSVSLWYCHLVTLCQRLRFIFTISALYKFTYVCMCVYLLFRESLTGFLALLYPLLTAVFVSLLPLCTA